MLAIADTNGTIIGFDPYYVRIQRNGSWGKCSAEEAEAIMVRNQRYSIEGREPVHREPLYDEEGNLIDPHPVAPTVHVFELPDGQFNIETLESRKLHTGQISDLETGAIDLADAVDAHTGQITDLETGAIDLADAVDTHTGQITDLETGTLDLADAVDTATVGTETALLDLGDNVALLMERIEALENELK